MNQRNVAAAQIAATLLANDGNIELGPVNDRIRRRQALVTAFELLDQADKVADEMLEFPAALVDEDDELPFK